jgi:hypothetical protein
MPLPLNIRVAPFDWGELEHDTEYYVFPHRHCGDQMLNEYTKKLELLFPNGDYDDSYDHLPKWEALRVDGHDKHHDKWDKRVSVKTKRNGNFISKKKENK